MIFWGGVEICYVAFIPFLINWREKKIIGCLYTRTDLPSEEQHFKRRETRSMDERGKNWKLLQKCHRLKLPLQVASFVQHKAVVNVILVTLKYKYLLPNHVSLITFGYLFSVILALNAPNKSGFFPTPFRDPTFSFSFWI